MMIDNQEEQSAKQYLELYAKLTDLVVKNNPNKITCTHCGVQFWIYSVGLKQENNLVREFYKNPNISDIGSWTGAFYCPSCGKEVVNVRARNKRKE